MHYIILSFFLLFSCLAHTKNISVRTEKTGFYSIKHNDILFDAKTKISKIHLNNNKGERPFFIESGKKTFQQEDRIIFFSEKLTGKYFYQHTLDDYNGYELSIGKKSSAYKKWQMKSKQVSKLPLCESVSSTQHIEENNLLIRVNTQQYQQTPELWYWKKISQINKEGFSVPLDFSQANHQSDASVTVAFRGVSSDKNAKELPDHEVQVFFNGKLVNTMTWEGKTQHESPAISLPAGLIKPEDNQIRFFIPKRREDKKRILDVVMLDYIDLQFNIIPEKATASNGLFSAQECQLTLNDNQFAYATGPKNYSFDTVALDSQHPVYIGNYETLEKPIIQPIKTIDIKQDETDYLIISHPLFLDTIQPLANFYQEKGMKVDVVDVNDIYQRHTYGIRELSAIKDFIKETYHAGNGRLSHVLLVGDSSWDWRNNEKYLDKYSSWANRRAPLTQNFNTQKHFKYDLELQNRDFIPTGQYHSSQGHSASDNWFVSIVPEENRKGEDYVPEIAIGRFTAATVEEAQAMVEKSIHYQSNSKVGPWKSRVLWITNANKGYQNFSQRISNNIGQYGSVAQNVFPKEMDGDNLKVQETLTKEINDGDLIVHFIGHGGNSIWRIGPPDVKKNRDLFTLDHIDLLNNKDNLPFVMSMSCYSAPYDHPVADSIGEKFFRAKDKGAIAVLAASWRNSPSQSFSKAVFNNIYENPQRSLGQSILKAKRFHRGRVALEMYNLLGDPALKLALPTRKIATKVSEERIDFDIEAQQFNGKANIEFIDHSNQVLKKFTIDVKNSQFNIPVDVDFEECSQGRIYAWDSTQNIDAMAGFVCDTEERIKELAALKELQKQEKQQMLKEKRAKARALRKEQRKNNKKNNAINAE